MRHDELVELKSHAVQFESTQNFRHSPAQIGHVVVTGEKFSSTTKPAHFVKGSKIQINYALKHGKLRLRIFEHVVEVFIEISDFLFKNFNIY